MSINFTIDYENYKKNKKENNALNSTEKHKLNRGQLTAAITTSSSSITLMHKCKGSC